MNERIKTLRNHLGLSGEKFGNAIGVKKAAISKIENNLTGVTEQNIKSICREFNVNEEWLRNGTGEMFNPVESISLDDLASELSPLELDIIKAYFTLDKDIRNSAIKHFKESLF